MTSLIQIALNSSTCFTAEKLLSDTLRIIEALSIMLVWINALTCKRLGVQTL